MKTAKVPCPWSEKGTVMRKLMESTDPERTLYFDGIKEHTGSGWALVVPDDDEPVSGCTVKRERKQRLPD